MAGIGARGRLAVINGAGGPLPASHHHVDIRWYSLLVGVPDILIIIVIWYRENVLDGTKAVFRCTLYHLKRFLLHGIGTHGYGRVYSIQYFEPQDGCSLQDLPPSALEGGARDSGRAWSCREHHIRECLL